MLLAAFLFVCCVSTSTDTPKASTGTANVNFAEETTTSKSNLRTLPDSPAAKNDSTSDSDATPAPVAESILPSSQPFSSSQGKPTALGTYETARQRGIWYGLMAAGHAAAVYDAYSTRQAISGGYGTEGDPFMRPFSHSNAIYAATQVSPAVMDYLGHRMLTSEHNWMLRIWWIPQVAGTSLSVGAGIHNSRLVR